MLLVQMRERRVAFTIVWFLIDDPVLLFAHESLIAGVVSTHIVLAARRPTEVEQRRMHAVRKRV